MLKRKDDESLKWVDVGEVFKLYHAKYHKYIYVVVKEKNDSLTLEAARGGVRRKPKPEDTQHQGEECAPIADMGA